MDTTVPSTRPRIVDRTEARQYFDRATWRVVEHLFGSESFLLLRRRG